MTTKQSENSRYPAELEEILSTCGFQKNDDDSSTKSCVVQNNEISLRPDKMAIMAEALGTDDSELGLYYLTQVSNTFAMSSLSNQQKVDNALAILSATKPKTELETMLLVQMISVHNLAMEFMNRAAFQNQSVDGVERNVNRATKLLRTYATQIDALNRLRGNSQQKVQVEHVHVHQGGQAIVGTVGVTRGEGNREK